MRTNSLMTGGFRSGMQSMGAFIATDLLGALLIAPGPMLVFGAAIGTFGGLLGRWLPRVSRRACTS